MYIGSTWLLSFLTALTTTAPVATPEQARRALERGVQFAHQQLAAEGGYLWRYQADLKLREGEGAASETTVWVQPPGTPSVGQALLEVYQRTGHAEALAAAKDAAGALVRGQLRSGGWDYRIEWNPKSRARYAYRVDRSETGKRRNTTTLDDNTTQAALRFLMRIDRELNFDDEQIHEATRFGLQQLLHAQYPNGAWPQRFAEPPQASEFPVVKANYPDSWSREFPGRSYQTYYTFNDNTISDMIITMLEAAEVYQDARYRQAAVRAGEFIRLAQLPPPQPAWAQQYDRNMHPAWARKFEPPAITGGESQGIISTLMLLYRQTLEARFLEPIPAALDYLESSKLPDGRLARFYEMQSNRPLYFTRDYQLTYSADDLPTHYAFQVDSRCDRLRSEYQRLLETRPTPTPWVTSARGSNSKSLRERAAVIIAEQDSRGAWIESDDLRAHDREQQSGRVISCQTLIRNLTILSQVAASTR